MVYIFIGVSGFIILFFFDLVALKKIRLIKTIIWIVGYGLIVFSLNMIIRRGELFLLPNSVKVTGIVLSAIFTILLIYSLLIEIPFKRTYLERGAGNKLVTTGTYALVRHPGVLWFILFLIGMFLVSGSKTLLVTIPVWGFMDVLYVIIQDKYYFPDQFGEAYKKYQSEVPMLIPTRASVKRCFATFINTKA